MSDEFCVRAGIVKNRVDQLCDEAARAPFARKQAIRAEVDVLMASLREIREEQLISYLPSPPKQRWWRRKRSVGGRLG